MIKFLKIGNWYHVKVNNSSKLNAKILWRFEALSHIYRRHNPHEIGVLFCLLPLLNTYNRTVYFLRTDENFPPLSHNIFMPRFCDVKQ